MIARIIDSLIHLDLNVDELNYIVDNNLYFEINNEIRNVSFKELKFETNGTYFFMNYNGFNNKNDDEIKKEISILNIKEFDEFDIGEYKMIVKKKKEIPIENDIKEDNCEIDYLKSIDSNNIRNIVFIAITSFILINIIIVAALLLHFKIDEILTVAYVSVLSLVLIDCYILEIYISIINRVHNNNLSNSDMVNLNKIITKKTNKIFKGLEILLITILCLIIIFGLTIILRAIK